MINLNKKLYPVNYRVILLFSVLILIGCKSKKALVNNRVITSFELSTLDNLLNENKLNYHTISLSGRAQFETPKEKQSFNYRIRLLSDSLIWVSAGVLGIEGYRILANRDSAIIIDRINRNYQVTNFEPLIKEFGLPLNFNTLQELILGQLPTVINSKNLQEKSTNIISFKYPFEKKNAIFELRPDNFRLENVKLIEKRELLALLTFSEYQLSEKIPFILTLNSFVTNPIKLKLHHSKVEVNPTDISFSFQVPEDYERKK